MSLPLSPAHGRRRPDRPRGRSRDRAVHI